MDGQAQGQREIGKIGAERVTGCTAARRRWGMWTDVAPQGEIPRADP